VGWQVVAGPERLRQLSDLLRERPVGGRRIGHAPLKRVHLVRLIEHPLLLDRGQHDVGILVHAKRLGVDGFAVHDERDLVRAAEYERSRNSGAAAEEASAAAEPARTAAAGAERTLLVLMGAAAPLRLAALLLGGPFGRRTATAAATPAGRGRRGDRRLHAQIPARGLDAGLRAVREQGAADLAHVFAR